jgi:hypothetical protein
MDDPIDLKEREDGRDVVVVTTKLIKKREREERKIDQSDSFIFNLTIPIEISQKKK